jgi:predicted esterase
VHDELPSSIDPKSRHVLYLHGRIIETHGRRPTHPEYGVYEYDRIVEALAAHGVQVLSEVRPADTGIGTYGQKVASQIRLLLAAGVPAERITVVGFSKGGIIAIAVSTLLRESDVRYVLLGACSRAVFDTAELRVTGRVLSIYEGSDEVGVSCAPLFARSPVAVELEEIRIDTGLRHGAFYEPRDAWLVPTSRWIHGGS